MARTNQVSSTSAYLSQTIPGYKGYASINTAYQTDRALSEEVLSELSETVAKVTRMKRSSENSFSSEMIAALDLVVDKVDRLAKILTETLPDEETLLRTLKSGHVHEIAGLDSQILVKVGNINQALSLMDLEGGAGISPEDLESVCELLDDLGNCISQRAALIGEQST